MCLLGFVIVPGVLEKPFWCLTEFGGHHNLKRNKREDNTFS